jgi:hypothetical protein
VARERRPAVSPVTWRGFPSSKQWPACDASKPIAEFLSSIGRRGQGGPSRFEHVAFEQQKQQRTVTCGHRNARCQTAGATSPTTARRKCWRRSLRTQRTGRTDLPPGGRYPGGAFPPVPRGGGDTVVFSCVPPVRGHAVPSLATRKLPITE